MIQARRATQARQATPDPPARRDLRVFKVKRGLPARKDRRAFKVKPVQQAIEEMGVDNNMEDLIRRWYQEHMTTKEYKEFLRNNGYSNQEIRGLKQGARDMLIINGPHLSRFIGEIFPEIINIIEIASSLCIIGRYKN